MIPRLQLTPRERGRTVQTLLSYLEDESRIVKTFSLQALATLAEQDPGLRPRVIALVEELLQSGIPSVMARARKLLHNLQPSAVPAQKLRRHLDPPALHRGRRAGPEHARAR